MPPVRRGCGGCGLTPSSPATTACDGCGRQIVDLLACRHCEGLLFPGDKFCGDCGRPHLEGVIPREPAASCDLRRLLKSTEFCRSCGTDVPQPSRECQACRLPVRLRPPAPSPVGWLYRARRGLRRRTGLAIPGDDGIDLYLDSGEVVPAGAADLTCPVPLFQGEPVARTPVVRLATAAQAVEQNRVSGRWDPDVLRDAAARSISDIHDARESAAELRELGVSLHVIRLPLSSTELSWVEFIHAASQRDLAAVWLWLARIPTDGYRAKVAALAALVPAIIARGYPNDLLLAHLGPFTSSEPLAVALGRVLGFGSGPAALVAQDAAQIAARLRLPSETVDALRCWAALVSPAGNVQGQEGITRLGPASRLQLAVRNRTGGHLRAGDLEGLPLSIVDDLLDSGTLTHLAEQPDALPPTIRAHVLSRTAPDRLTESEVETLRMEAESARRAFLNEDMGALAAGGESPSSRHYRALAYLRNRDRQQFSIEDIRPSDRRIAADLAALIDADEDRVRDHITSRLVSDPTVWPVLAQVVRPTALPPSPELAARFPRFCEWLALHQAREHLYNGNWSDALASVEACLNLAEGEAVRDEALNLKACALHYLDRDSEAIAALEEAIEGEYSEALLSNVGLIATRLRPELAAMYLGKLIREAPSVTMKAAAGRRAVEIWRTSDTQAWRGAGDSGGPSLPEVIRDPLRELVDAPISLDDFRAFVSLLAVMDQGWLQPGRIQRSPHRDSLEARAYLARARDLHEFIDLLGAEIRSGGAPVWLKHERDSLREAAIEILLTNLDNPDNLFGPAALRMVEAGAVQGDYDEILFTGLGIANIAYYLSETKAEIGDHVADKVHVLRTKLAAMHESQRSALSEVVEIAIRRVAINRLMARERDLNAAIDVFNSAIDLVRSSYPASEAWQEAARRKMAVASVAVQAQQDLDRWLPIVEHEAVATSIRVLIDQSLELQRRCRAS